MRKVFYMDETILNGAWIIHKVGVDARVVELPNIVESDRYYTARIKKDLCVVIDASSCEIVARGFNRDHAMFNFYKVMGV